MPYYIDQIKEKFYQSEWNSVYDFLEFMISLENYDQYRNSFIARINQVFIDERAPYKIIDGIITPLISDQEAEEIETAIESKYTDVSGHIKKALELYKKRPVADYQNSIKESISAVEALARTVLNKPSATLGELTQQLKVHPALQDAIKKLYGWTSDEGGIRHSEKGGDLNVDVSEARFMLVQCSALVNYVISKYE
jgi:hypothetical protein